MKIDVFVSHHTDSSLHIVEGIVNKLEGAGIRCWYAPRDTVGTYAGSITQAIEQCRLFLLILNRPSSESFHVLNELDTACGRLAKGEDVTIIPFHVADEEENLGKDAKYYIRRIHWIDAMTPPMHQRINELVGHICKMLGNGCAADLTCDSEKTAGYRLVSSVPQVRDVFVGREGLLEKIHAMFLDGARTVYLEGMGGIGKSELAKQYAITRHEDYDTVIFFTYEGSLRQAICDQTAVIVEGLVRRPEEDEAAFFSRKLQLLKQLGNARTLFILDNFDVDEDPDLSAFLSGSYRVIITSRNVHPGVSSVKVEAIRDHNALVSIFEQNYGGSVYDIDTLKAIFQQVDYHTYTIELIAKQMEASFLSVKEMHAILEQGKAADQFIETVAGRNKRDTAFGHISALFDTSKLSNEEIWVMRCLSLTGIGGIKAPMLRQWAGLENFEAINRLIRRSWMRKNKDQNVSLHPLVREVVHAKLRPDLQNMRGFLEAVGKFCYGAWGRSYKENLDVVDSIQATIEYFHGGDAENYVQFEAMIGYLWQVGRFDASIRYGHLLYDACVAKFGVADMRTGFAAKALGGCYFNSNRREESVAWYYQGFESMKASGAPESEDLALSYEKVGRCCTWEFCRDFEKAKAYLNESLAIRLRLKERISQGEHLELLTGQEPYNLEMVIERIGESYMELGRMYQHMGQYEAALECTQNYANMQDQISRTSDNARAYAAFDMGVSHYHIALRLREDGNEEAAIQHLTQAERLLDKALQSNLKLRGHLAVDTIKNQEYLADVYTAQGRYGNASNAYMAALNMAEKLLGEHSDKVKEIQEKMTFSVSKD